MGTKRLFLITYHPQIDGQTEVVYRILTILLITIIQKNLKNWEDCLMFVEFAYNRSVLSIIDYSSFKIVYNFNPLTFLDLISLLVDEKVSLDGNIKTQVVKTIFDRVRWQIQQKNEQYTFKANKSRKRVILELRDWV